MTKAISLAYEARGPFKAFHDRKHRRAVMVCHRRAGKTVACINELIFRALRTKKPNARFVYIGPYKTQTKDIVWTYLLQFVAPFGNLVKINNLELSVTFVQNGASIRLFGADNPDSLRGMYFDGVVLDEYADMKPDIWNKVISPALGDRDGWVVFIGTPKGHNSFYDLREIARKNPDKYFYLELKASESGFLTQEFLDSEREEKGDAEYNQEYECDFEAAIQGSFYAEQIGKLEQEGHVTNVPWIPEIEVQTAWDLGMADSLVIWFYQIVGGRVHVIDLFETSRTELKDVVQFLRDKPYKYGVFNVPHDSIQDNLQTGKSIIECLWEFGFDMRYLPRLSVKSGINAVRIILHHCWFDANACHTGIESLKLYSKEYSRALDMFTERPRHDIHSHYADAFRYLATAVRDNELAGVDELEMRSPVTHYVKGVAYKAEEPIPKMLNAVEQRISVPQLSLTPKRTRSRV